MTITITIDTDNAAFEDLGGEVAAILRRIAEGITVQGVTDRRVLDSNGNTVGRVTVKGKL